MNKKINPCGNSMRELSTEELILNILLIDLPEIGFIEQDWLSIFNSW